MNSLTRHSLVSAVIRSSQAVLSKSASATPEQAEVLNAAWPDRSEGLSKRASLARILATGLLVEEAEQSLVGG